MLINQYYMYVCTIFIHVFAVARNPQVVNRMGRYTGITATSTASAQDGESQFRKERVTEQARAPLA